MPLPGSHDASHQAQCALHRPVEGSTPSVGHSPLMRSCHASRGLLCEYRIGGTVGGGRDATYALCRGALTYVSVRDIGTYYALRLPFGRQAQLMRMKYMSNLSGSQGKLIVELENWQVYTGKCVCVSACNAMNLQARYALAQSFTN